MLVTNQKWAGSNSMVSFTTEDNEMDKRVPMKGGDEYDGLTKARKFLIWKSGQLKRSSVPTTNGFVNIARRSKMNNDIKVNGHSRS
jgi:hypothetical protein